MRQRRFWHVRGENDTKVKGRFMLSGMVMFLKNYAQWGAQK